MEAILPISLSASGGAALINLWLSIRIGRIRHRTGVMLGDGAVPNLIAAMRAQANFIEFTPIILILIALIEYTIGSTIWLWLVAALYLIGRVLHGLGMTGFAMGRSIGTVISMLTMLGLGVYAFALPLIVRADYITSADDTVVVEQVISEGR